MEISDMKLLAKAAAIALAATLTTGVIAPLAEAAPATERRATFKPTLKASKTVVLSTHTLVLSGKVRPAKKGTTVVLQQNLGSKWTTVKRVKTNSHGTFRYRDRVNKVGHRKFRAVVPAQHKVKRGHSSSVAVGVYRWTSLNKLSARTTDAFWPHPTDVSINGKIYRPSYLGVSDTTTGKADWNVLRKCIRLTGVFGNSDEANTGVSANFTVGLDAATVDAGSYALTQSQAKTFDLTNVFRLTVTWTSTTSGTATPQAGSRATLAVPQVLCTI